MKIFGMYIKTVSVFDMSRIVNTETFFFSGVFVYKKPDFSIQR
jgi:hypothetical protein